MFLYSILSQSTLTIASTVRTHSLFCRYVFCDFGDKFTVYDTNGEPPRTCIISHITQAEEGVVTVHDEQRHDLEDGDVVTFAEIEVRTAFLYVHLHTIPSIVYVFVKHSILL